MHKQVRSRELNSMRHSFAVKSARNVQLQAMQYMVLKDNNRVDTKTPVETKGIKRPDIRLRRLQEQIEKLQRYKRKESTDKLSVPKGRGTNRLASESSPF